MKEDIYPDVAQGMRYESANSTINPIEIRQLSYGYKVKIGCLEIAIESKEKLITMLTLYIEDPKGVEDHWNEAGNEIFNI